MKTMGLIGGMSWESTVTYYRLINEAVRSRLGGHHSAKMLLYNVDFAEIEHLQQQGRWDEAGSVLADAAISLQRAGAEFVVLCTNTMHKVAPAIESAISIPLLHIADATARAVKTADINTVGLLGTKFTMEQDFYLGRLRDKYQLNVLVPDANDRNAVHRVIYEELVKGQVNEHSRQVFMQIIQRLTDRGANGIILGCTEISMLVAPSMISIPCFDTTELHANSAVDFALA